MALVSKPSKRDQTIQSEQMGPNVETGLNVQSGPCDQNDRCDQTSPNFQIRLVVTSKAS